MNNNPALAELLQQVRACRVCEKELPLGANPILRVASSASILIVGQAPGTKVHQTGIPWNDPSGDRLRNWLKIDRELFYDESKIAIIPMGFCYPGKGKSGDLPPRSECAPLWHEPLLQHIPGLKLTLLVGQYAQNYYLQDDYKTLAERVKNWRDFAPDYLPLPHPSPRNQLWLRRNPWFEAEVIPELRRRVSQHLRNA